MSDINHQSVSKRFVISFIGNVGRSCVSFLTSILLARWLGPSEFGRLSFLLASFISLRMLVDMSTSNAFFTFISRKQRSLKLITYHWIWLAIQIMIPLLLIVFILPTNVIELIWNGSLKGTIVLALIASSMQGVVWTTASQMSESQRLNSKVQSIGFAISIVHLAVLIFLYLAGLLAVQFVFVAIAIEWGIAAWLSVRLYFSRTKKVKYEDEPETFKIVLKEYVDYCRPMVFYGALTFLYEFADRWMLQHWAGPSHQAYFAVAQSFSAIALLATTSTLSIFWKEISAASHRGDQESVALYYKKFIRILYFSATFISCALIPWSKEIVQLLVGSSYSAGSLSFMIMCLYPIHQTIGQLDGTLLYSTGRTSFKMKTTIWFTISSLIMTYFTLAPKNAFIPGLGLLSEGIALKMIIIQVIYVNIINWIISRKFNWKFSYSYQIYNLFIFLVLSTIVHILVNLFLLDLLSASIRMLISTILYFLASVTILFRFPLIAGISRKELLSFIDRARNKF
jgi:O-antigen/teichoic acid export membrane protein